ncbi:MAG: large conductance mechanosensitive channel protein MscL [Hydrotalea flava]|uniref:large conductance mechanosensitive channel protein MscL n=1 Tax=Hydrotalea TaxID=1004300 RepID=UPI000943CC08|nr:MULTISPECIES: large conductance mechanosensitive channel protein MscL [Hydrotalea]MBY0349260.1 large conductance mechanosensitive channel protein MscL [Hydrotalea flava]NIM35075.1 large conductance mechanosensitive channel protein MscL [Hydrotalea flava]NIM37901.1 large conductance mechanosensitive channel protein MscL [Hydrotalea flava]NIN03070.1 large conductance mechanosensitive channel protein MscL [Hydrotalea flava]NIN14755.1 large conductance mechanosensitive channel protein MscL [Hyd
MSFVKEFREFATKGNVMDLAVGVIIGGAFGKIVDSVVNDLIMPVVGILFKADFTNLYLPLSSKVTQGLTLVEAKKLGPVFAWGSFVTAVINFIILAFVIFLLVKGMNRLKRKNEAAAPPPGPTPTEQLLMEIRDALKK